MSRYIRTNGNIYEVVKECKCYFVVKDRRVFAKRDTCLIHKRRVMNLGDEYFEDKEVRPMCDIFFRTYSEHTGFFGQPVIDIDTRHPRIYEEQQSQIRCEGKYTEYNKFDWYGAVVYKDKTGRPHVNVVSKMNKNGDFELIEEIREVK